MNKFFFFFLMLLCGFVTVAQEEAYGKIRQVLAEKRPDLQTSSRVIAFNTWTDSDPEGREANKSFEKAYKTFEFARLKGGLQGLVVVTINRSGSNDAAMSIALAADGVKKIIPLRMEDLAGLDLKHKNAVFDSGGKMIYRDLPPSGVFSAIQNLITR
jgi:hypothetical protein